MRNAMTGLGLGLTIGLLGVLLASLPAASGWEEEIGLDLLFRLRGAQTPPPEVVLVALDGDSGRRLGLSDELTRWPRSVYVRLLERLRSAGATVIVFDIYFKRSRDPVQDRRLASAMRRAGNVILVGYLEREVLELGEAGPGGVEIERLRPPVQALAEAAAAVAPFVLPKVPVKVSRFWTFHGANELASLPAAALEHWTAADRERLYDLMQRTLARDADRLPALEPETDRQHALPAIRTLLRADPRLRVALQQALRSADGSAMPEPARLRLEALLALYGDQVRPYLNFYGPPGSLTRIPLHEVLQAPRDQLQRLQGKVVFVGYADRYQPKQKDGFYTVFSQADGLDLSGVEIAATAFANLLHRETIRPLGSAAKLSILLGYGILLTLLLRLLPGLGGLALGLLAALGYFALVYGLFSTTRHWLPWFIPLVLQTPLAVLGVAVWRYREAHLGRQRLRQVFGYYLPGEVVDRLAEQTGPALAPGESAFGVCLASDAEQYTRLAESMPPEALKALLNRYYELLFTPVRSRGGTISDVVGDAMMAIWSAPGPDASIRRRACEAALEIRRAVAATDMQPVLRTRIGLHAGELMMSHVGAMDHYEYRAVGDIVNTAARIENLNKLLQTRVLASESMVEGLDGFVFRELGWFLLKGKRRALKVYEVVAEAGALDPELHELLERFAAALRIWQQGDRQRARQAFQALHQDYPTDGPTGYYLSLFTPYTAPRQGPAEPPLQS